MGKIERFKDEVFIQNSLSKKYGLANAKDTYIDLNKIDLILMTNIEDIKQLLKELSNLDQIPLKKKFGYAALFDRYKIYRGMQKYGYYFGELLTQEEIPRFEKVYNITLPKEYRDFLMEIGNGAFPGAMCGLSRLILENYCQEYELLKREFPYTKSFTDEVEECDDIDDCDFCPRKNECISSLWVDDIEYEHPSYVKGTLELAYDGCTYWYRLVVTGPLRGSVWMDTHNGMVLLYKDFNEYMHDHLNKFLKPAIDFYQKIVDGKSVEEILENEYFDKYESIIYLYGLLRIYKPEFEKRKENIHWDKYIEELKEEIALLK